MPNGEPNRHSLIARSRVASGSSPAERTAPSRSGPRFGLTARFAIASLGVFIAAGASLHFLVAGRVRAEHQRFVVSHAVFVTDSLIREAFRPEDLQSPVTGARYQDLRSFVADRVLVGGVLRIKVWRPDGTVLFSDEPRLVGRRFSSEAGVIRAAVSRGPQSEISDLAEDENLYERGLARSMFATYVPLRLHPNAAPTAAVEVYQDYGPTAAEITRALRAMDAFLVASLFLLYALMLPIASRTGRTLRRQAAQLEELLSRERETVRRLRELDRMKDEFLTATSHELRTPLTVILGVALTLEKATGRLAPKRSAELLERLSQNARTLERLVKNLLDLDRLTKRSFTPERTLVDMTAMVRRSVKSVDRQGHPVRVRAERVVGEVDEGQIERCLDNLLHNAVRHTPRGTPILVRLWREPAGVALAVEDTGPGVPDTVKTSIFEPFERGAAPKHSPGTGIGLAIVSRFVEMHGGRAWVEDRPGGGASFRLLLPDPQCRAAADGNGRGPRDVALSISAPSAG